MKKFLSLLMLVFLFSNVISTSADAKSKKNTEDKKIVVSDAPKIKIESNKPTTWCPELKIGLYTLNAPFKANINMNGFINDITRDKKFKTVNKDEVITFSAVNNEVKINGESTDSSEIELRPQLETELRNMQTKINGKPYFGGLKLIAVKNNLVVINIVTVEEYLRGVLPKEMSPSWDKEALKAQAVAARTFALKNRKRHSNQGYDLCSTVHCQSYDGIEMLDNRTDEAISSTFGEVIYYKDKLIEAPFHTDSGGITENAVDVWGTDYPYLRATTEIESETMSWTVHITFEEFSKRLKESGHDVGEVRLIKVTNLELGKVSSDRSSSGRVKFLSVVGSGGEIKLTGNEMRNIFGLKSTLFDAGINDEAIVITGYGWGHGVGMSQYGAQNFAEHGYSYDKILNHYYKDTEIKRLY